MSISSGIKRICESVGKNNNPANVVVAIAVAKGIFRPLFTMTDKKESPETKKYTALREGLTEVIAIPTYLACGALAGKGADLIKDPEKAKMARHNLRLAGVCTAALIVIPGLCSLLIKPFTNIILKKTKKNENSPAKLDITSETEMPEIKQHVRWETANKPVFAPFHGNAAVYGNSGMRV